jgi:DNA-binding NarL/FixJ family response regulator
MRESDRQVLSTGESISKIEEVTLPDRRLFFLTFKFAIPQADTSPHLGGISLDITKRREAEKAVEDSERRLREAQRIALVGNWEYDPKTEQFRWSEQLFNLFERDPEVGAPKLDEALSYYAPESQVMVRAHIDRLAEEEDRGEMDLRAELPSGRSVYHYLVMNTIRGEDGKVAKIAGTIQDITARKEAEEQLRQTSEQLDIERRALESKNIALREVLDQIEAEKEQLKQQFATNVEEAILPTLIRLKESSPPTQRRNFELLETELREVSSPFLNKIKSQFSKLSPRELEVCRLIKNGLTSKEIAESLNLSPATVQKHRELIRRKLGLVNDGVNLQSFLKSM